MGVSAALNSVESDITGVDHNVLGFFEKYGIIPPDTEVKLLQLLHSKRVKLAAAKAKRENPSSDSAQRYGENLASQID